MTNDKHPQPMSQVVMMLDFHIFQVAKLSYVNGRKNRLALNLQIPICPGSTFFEVNPVLDPV
ncbi:MAG: hypothetical protein LJE92_10990 [Gammaproteobacteria bacterium]|jgi:hypothetical protein|nr:hypothetical protein [Gammaproteobacteria bacterium]